MNDTPWWRRILEPVLSIGAYPGEPEIRRSGRRVFLIAFIIATLATIPQVFSDLEAGYTWVAIGGIVTTVITFVLLIPMWFWPHRLGGIVNAMFVVIFVSQLAETAMFGGLLESGLVVMFGVGLVLAAMLTISLRAAIGWLVAYTASVIYAVLIPNWVDPIYRLKSPTDDAAFNLIATGVLMMAVLAYFVRQRDRYQAALGRAAAQHPARRDRRPAEGLQRHDRRRRGRGLGPVRRRRRLHADVGRAVPGPARRAARRGLLVLRRVRRRARAREDQDGGRRVHGGRRGPPAPPGPR